MSRSASARRLTGGIVRHSGPCQPDAAGHAAGGERRAEAGIGDTALVHVSAFASRFAGVATDRALVLPTTAWLQRAEPRGAVCVVGLPRVRQRGAGRWTGRGAVVGAGAGMERSSGRRRRASIPPPRLRTRPRPRAGLDLAAGRAAPTAFVCTRPDLAHRIPGPPSSPGPTGSLTAAVRRGQMQPPTIEGTQRWNTPKRPGTSPAPGTRTTT